MASRGTHNGTVVCPSGNRRNVAQLGSRMRRASKTRWRAVRPAQCFHPAQQLTQGRCRYPGTGLILRYEAGTDHQFGPDLDRHADPRLRAQIGGSVRGYHELLTSLAA
jgi:hypothetical protein